MLFNIFPYIYQNHINPPDKVYIGSLPIFFDKPAYLAEMAQGKEGAWKITDKFTTEPQEKLFIYPLYVLMGHISRVSNLSTEIVFFLGRFFFGLVLLFTVLRFIRYFISDKNQIKLAYFFALFSSGLGWLTKDMNSPDLGIPDYMPIVRFSYFPHFLLANIAFLLTLIFFWRIFENKRSKLCAIFAGISSFILNFVLPFSAILLYFLIASLLIILFFKNKILIAKNLRNILLFFAILTPSLAYMYYISAHDKIWSIIEKQNILPSPSPTNLVTGFGLILIFSIYGLWIIYQKNRVKGLFFSVWILSVPVLAYIPLWIYPMQRRFLETGFYIPLAITASFGIKGIWEYLKNKNIKYLKLKLISIFGMFILPLMLAGNIQNWFQFEYAFRQTENPKFYATKENMSAIEWLHSNSPKSAIVLSSFYSGILIPAYANRSVYIGHNPLTIDFEGKIKKSKDFYSNRYSPGEMSEFLKNENINYVFYSNEEKKLGNIDLEQYSFLNKIYCNETVRIYEFTDKN